MRRRVDRYDFWKAISLLSEGWTMDWETYDRMRDFVATLGEPA